MSRYVIQYSSDWRPSYRLYLPWPPERRAEAVALFQTGDREYGRYGPDCRAVQLAR